MPPQTSHPRPLLGRLSDAVPTLYLVTGGLLLLLFSLLTPPFSNPDEAAHAERGLQIAHGEWIAHYAPAGETVTVLTDDMPPANSLPLVVAKGPRDAYGTSLDRGFLLAAMQGTYVQREFIDSHHDWKRRPDGRFPLGRFDSIRAVRWSRSSIFIPFLNTAVYPPPLYLAAALAWRIGEATDARIVSTLYAARLCNALLALGLGWLALRVAGSNRLLFLAFLLLPAVLAIESSCAQDALVLPLALLCASLLVRALSEQRLYRNGELALLALGLALCAAARPPYLALSVVLFLPSLDRQALQPRRLVPPVAAFAGVLCGFGLWRFLIRDAALAVSAVASPPAQIAFMKAHPFAAMAALVRGTVLGLPEQVFRGVEVVEMQGALRMALLYGVHILAFAGIVVLARRVVLQRAAGRLLLLAALLAIVAGIAVVEYLIWTRPGARAVIGAQARYYLPLLPFALLLALRPQPNNGGQGSDSTCGFLAPRLLLGCFAVFFAGVLYTPFVLAHRYYALSLPSALAHVLR